VEDYLRNVGLDRISELDFDPFGVTYTTQPGDAVPTPPADLPIWVASSSGRGTKTLEWATEPGEWSVVVMNADGSANVDANVAVAAKAPFVFRVGLGLAIGGGVLLLVAGAALIVTIRSRPKTAGPLSRTSA
jgi:hypothetical protein